MMAPGNKGRPIVVVLNHRNHRQQGPSATDAAPARRAPRLQAAQINFPVGMFRVHRHSGQGRSTSTEVHPHMPGLRGIKDSKLYNGSGSSLQRLGFPQPPAGLFEKETRGPKSQARHLCHGEGVGDRPRLRKIQWLRICGSSSKRGLCLQALPRKIARNLQKAEQPRNLESLEGG